MDNHAQTRMEGLMAAIFWDDLPQLALYGTTRILTRVCQIPRARLLLSSVLGENWNSLHGLSSLITLLNSLLTEGIGLPQSLEPSLGLPQVLQIPDNMEDFGDKFEFLSEAAQWFCNPINEALIPILSPLDILRLKLIFFIHLVTCIRLSHLSSIYASSGQRTCHLFITLSLSIE